jgi:lipid-A-disaccharide synthase
VAPDAKLVLVLFGSRRAEVRRLAGPIADAMTALKVRFGDRIRFVAPLAGAVATQVRAASADDPRLQDAIMVDEPERDDAFRAADVAIACSGTVVTEVAMAGVPSVVVYRLGALSHALVKAMLVAPHISLVNMAAGERLLPELTQGGATGEAIAAETARFLEDEAYAAAVRAKLAGAVARMRGDGGSATGRAADAVVELLKERGLATD